MRLGILARANGWSSNLLVSVVYSTIQNSYAMFSMSWQVA